MNVMADFFFPENQNLTILLLLLVPPAAAAAWINEPDLSMRCMERLGVTDKGTTSIRTV